MLFLAIVLSGCSVEPDGDASGTYPPAYTSGGPAQRSCDELVECLETERETGRQTCVLEGQDALPEAQHALDVCAYTLDDNPNGSTREDCLAAQCYAE